MTNAAAPRWETKRTEETRMVEEKLQPHFEQVDCYRYNSASIRVRVIDSRFEGASREQRDDMVEQHLDELPIETQKDIVTLMTFAPSELNSTSMNFKEFLLNSEFEDPSPSKL